MRSARVLFAIAALAAIAAVAAPGASPGATSPSGATLTVEPSCRSYPQFQGVSITLSGFPPRTDVVGNVDSPDGHFGPVTVQTDDNGEYSNGLENTQPGDWTVTVEWSEGTLTESLHVNCGGPNGSLGVDPTYQLEFPPQAIGYFSPPRQFTLTNYGPGVMTVNRAHVTSGPDDEFLIASDSCTGRPVPVRGTCFIRVRFGPERAGPDDSYLHIASSATDSPYLKYLQGSGTSISVAERGPPISGSVQPSTVTAGPPRCFDFRSVGPTGNPVPRALVRFAGEKTRTDDDGVATICKSFPYRGTRTARLRKRGYRSVLLLIRVLATP